MSYKSENYGPIALYLDEGNMARCFKGDSHKVMMSLRYEAMFIIIDNVKGEDSSKIKY